MRADVLILGAGASGLTCAVHAAQGGRDVLVLDHARRAAPKVRIAGGGRCNVTNTGADAEHYVCPNPHFVKSALARCSPWEVMDLLRSGGLEPVEEDRGRVFCAQGAGAVAGLLQASARRAGARLELGVAVESAVRQDDGFLVHTDAGVAQAPCVVLALGGPAWPQCGATDLGVRLARSLGLPVHDPAPGLVPLQAGPEDRALCESLAGTALPAAIAVPGGPTCEGDLLFTHTGVSGPAVLDASLYWRSGETLAIDLAPGADVAAALAAQPRKDVGNALAAVLPRRPARAWAERLGLSGPVGGLSAKALDAAADAVRAWSFTPAGTAGLKRAEVTLGGVDPDAVSSKTMRAKDAPGLYVVGELLDVTGRLGGFNLHWAWASGKAAGQAIASAG